MTRIKTPEYCLDYEEHTYDHFGPGGECATCGATLEDYFVWAAGLWENGWDDDAKDDSASTGTGPTGPVAVPRENVGRVERWAA